MNRPNPFNTAILAIPNLMNRSPLQLGVLFALALGLFPLSPRALAVDPPPDGGYTNENTAEGDDALQSLTTGAANTAVGFAALFSNTTGDLNTAIGVSALSNNITGTQNTANGAYALNSNATGSFNTATGFKALQINNGSNNTATGFNALLRNKTGATNMANGFSALKQNTTGNKNSASGSNALRNNTIGHDNTAIGASALQSNTTGIFNIAVGSDAGGRLTTGSNNIDIGSSGVGADTDTIRIGTVKQTATYITGIFGATVRGAGVIIDSTGHLGTITSSARFKEAIKPMDKASEAILALQPVTFRYKHELDPDGILQFGLVAEQVEKISPDLVARDEEGKAYTVRYEAVNAMLLNEFLKEHRKLEDLKKDFQATIAQQQKQIEALTATVQKVSDQVALSKPAPQLVANR